MKFITQNGLLILLLAFTHGQIYAKTSLVGKVDSFEKCSQNRNVGMFASDEERELRCQKANLKSGTPCQILLDEVEAPEKINVTLGQSNLKSFKGGVWLWEKHRRVGLYKKGKSIFRNKDLFVDQVEVLLERDGIESNYGPSEAVIYLNHKLEGNRLIWDQYNCIF